MYTWLAISEESRENREGKQEQNGAVKRSNATSVCCETLGVVELGKNVKNSQKESVRDALIDMTKPVESGS